MTEDDTKRVRQLEEGNRRLTKLVANLALGNSILKEEPPEKSGVSRPDATGAGTRQAAGGRACSAVIQDQ